MAIPYSGPDRRKHRVYYTHNTEYHLHDGICVAVRDRRTGEFQKDHVAMGQRLQGSVAQGKDGFAGFHLQPEVGDSMLFQAGQREIITSALERVSRPPRQVIEQYPSMSQPTGR